MRPEWTSTNPKYVNCLMIQTEDVPVALCAAAGWAGPEGLFVVTRRPDFAAARERIAGGDGDGPHGGALSLWAITRNLIEVPACTFDAPTRKAAYLDCEAKAAGDWRAAVNALRKWAHTNDEAITAESAAKAATSNRLRELLRYASLHRKGLNEPLDANSLTLSFELARRY